MPDKRMTDEQFVYWLQGFVEMTGGDYPSTAQWEMIVDHLEIVFDKITPKLDKVLSEEEIEQIIAKEKSETIGPKKSQADTPITEDVFCCRHVGNKIC